MAQAARLGYDIYTNADSKWTEKRGAAVRFARGIKGQTVIVTDLNNDAVVYRRIVSPEFGPLPEFNVA